jgi:translation elongation factor EF-Tu-like GTPase
MNHRLLLCAVASVVGLASQGALSAEVKVPLLAFPKGKELPASVTLLKLNGKVGRDNPFYDGYRPQLRFVGTRQEVSCAVRVPEQQEKVEPGETASVRVACIEDFKLPENDLSFVMFEGGRQVGQGVLKP